MQDLDALLSKLFPCGVTLETTGDVCAGIGELADGPVVLVGTRNEAFIGAEIAHALTGHILAAMRDHPGRPILMLVDNAGQRLSRRDEMLGNNAYLANLAKALDVARRRGHVVLSLVYGRAVSGGFLACGMSAEGCLALGPAEIGIMSLDAMARITKVPRDRLEELNKSMAIFGPGVENFHKLGVVEEIWGEDEDLSAKLTAAIGISRDAETRRRDGSDRDGRRLAVDISRRVRSAPRV